MNESLDIHLQRILFAINTLTKDTSLISLNAGIVAAKISSNEGKAFNIIAQEIRRLSDTSIHELKNLETVLRDVRSLYNVINIAGRQRMLSQKIMKLKLLMSTFPDQYDQFHSEYRQSIRQFEESMTILRNCEMNNKVIISSLDLGSKIWQEFVLHIESGKLEEAVIVNEKLLFQMNEVTKAYESLSG